MPNAALFDQVYVMLDGQEVPSAMLADVLGVTVECSLHLPSVATVELHDPTLRWIDSSSIEPGHVLRVSGKADQSESPLFEGEIVEIEPDFTETTQRLMIRAFDRMHRLSRGRFVRSFKEMSDSDIISKLASEVGLKSDVDAQGPSYRYVLQANETNLEFLRRRASTLGCLLYVEQSTLYCRPNRLTKNTVELHWGKSLLTFRPRMTTTRQSTDVIVRGWDINQCQTIMGRGKNGDSPPQIGEKTPGGDYAKKAFNLDHTYLVTDRPIRSQAVADLLAKSVANNHTGRFIEADGRCTGDPRIVTGAAVHITTVGDRFSGTYIVTNARHEFIPEMGYSTTFSVTAYNSTTLLDLLAPQSDRVPISGVAVAVVTDNNDPDGWGRVKVRFPWLSDDHASYWARVAIVGGGSDRGIEFLPEVNDEVLVGFELGDPEVPYVIGGLWNGRDSPPKKSADVLAGNAVKQRLIKSRTGHLVILDDGDNDGNITIQDRNGNTIVLTCSDNKLAINVQGDVTITSGGNVDIEANGGGVTINANAGNMSLQAQGSMTLTATEGITINGGTSVDVDADMIDLN